MPDNMMVQARHSDQDSSTRVASKASYSSAVLQSQLRNDLSLYGWPKAEIE